MSEEKTRAPAWEVIGPATIQITGGEKLELSLRKARTDADGHANAQVISLLDGDAVYSEGKSRVKGLACPACGATHVRRTGASALYAVAGHYPHRPTAYRCEACGHTIRSISALVDCYVEHWRSQLALYRKVAGTQPQEFEWTIAEVDGQRAFRPETRHAIDALMTASFTGTQIRLVRVVAYQEQQVLDVLHSSDLPFAEVEIDRLGRPLSPWSTRPSVAERNELAEAQQDHRREVEVAIDDELRALRHQKLAAAGYA